MADHGASQGLLRLLAIVILTGVKFVNPIGAFGPWANATRASGGFEIMSITTYKSANTPSAPKAELLENLLKNCFMVFSFC
jgi:hypothetical protein